MSVSITKYFSAEIDLGDVFRSSDDYRFCAAKNVGEFCEFDQSNGLFSYVLRADSEDDLEEAILDFLSTHEMCLLLKVYDTNGDIDGIDIAEIKDIVHIDYQNAWSDSGRNSVLKDGFINGFSKNLGHSMLGFNNGEHDLVVFFDTKQNLIDNFDSFEEGLEELPLNDKFKEFDLGEPVYGKVAVIPATIASKYFDISDLDFS